ncbi:MAG: LEA type 2 family protein [Gammaproteobacteria bacterium]
MTSRSKLFSAVLALALLLPGCATLGPNYEQPTVTLSSFNAIPSEGMVPAFEVGLRIINPNTTALDMVGVVYTISVAGHELVKGVGRDFETIDGYSEGEVKLTASANLLAGIQFIGDMMNNTEETMEYEFKAKLDLSGLYPSINIRETGQINLFDTPSTETP